MMDSCTKLPVSKDERGVAAKAKAIVHYQFDAEFWEYREETGVDVGIDCIFDLIEENQWMGNRVFCQIKGRTNPQFVNGNTEISISLKISTINYLLNQKNISLLLLVDVKNEIVYFLALHEYFIHHPEEFKKFVKNSSNLTVRIPVENTLLEHMDILRSLAKKHYIYIPNKRVISIHEEEKK